MGLLELLGALGRSLAPSLPVLAWLTLLLVLLAFGLALLALGYRAQARRRMERRQRLAAEWDPRIVEALFAGDETAPFLVADEDRLPFVGNLLRFARRLAGEDRERVRRLALPFLPEVAARAQRRSPAVRARAVQTLGELGWPEYRAEIVRGLDDESPLVTMMAVQTLARPASVEHMPDVLQRLPRLTDWTPRFLASTLAAGGPEAAPALRAALADPTHDAWVRSAVAEALRQLNDFGSADVAADVLELEVDREVVAATLRLLGQVGNSDHLDVVTRRTSDPDFVVRVAAADALSALGGPEELERLKSMVYEDPSQWVALRAARSLLQAGWRAELRALALSSHPRAAIGSQVLAEGSPR
ncbi:MAG: HEAT repeat domain-containing protein [Gemmatimonadota bacterium]|nr:HEAT repeat domain-containing protein [Gemmatimonadota bacterium]